ncbi:hypothetical protein HMPREF9296_2564 [Prevotella disiens FB035-09AN]|uniref:Uncharacterized protein n=1 Tax=Prevotella disiens FB035-09AN TaxID=866771 RepID=E1KP28_9BACT|nr:hypothetical protein HMPREF9296_2564 [Prevotella disiens FB035-09AN]
MPSPFPYWEKNIDKRKVAINAIKNIKNRFVSKNNNTYEAIFSICGNCISYYDSASAT